MHTVYLKHMMSHASLKVSSQCQIINQYVSSARCSVVSHDTSRKDLTFRSLGYAVSLILIWLLCQSFTFDGMYLQSRHIDISLHMFVI